MAIGMSYEDYWDGEPEKAHAFLKAHKLKTKMENEKLWLQGLYFYEALCDVAPVLNAFAKSGTKPTPYVEKPYSLTRAEAKVEDKKHAQAVMEKGKARMIDWMNRTNAARKKLQEEVNAHGRDDGHNQD